VKLDATSTSWQHDPTPLPNRRVVSAGEDSLASPVLSLVGFWIVVVGETLNGCTPHTTLMVGGCFVKGDMTEPDRDHWRCTLFFLERSRIRIRNGMALLVSGCSPRQMFLVTPI